MLTNQPDQLAVLSGQAVVFAEDLDIDGPQFRMIAAAPPAMS